MNESKLNEQPAASTPVACSDIVRRQWCIEKAIQWAGRPDDPTQTDEMIDMAAMIDRYITTGAHSKMIELAALEAAMSEAERTTKNVSMPKAKAVCDEIMQRVLAA